MARTMVPSGHKPATANMTEKPGHVGEYTAFFYGMTSLPAPSPAKIIRPMVPDIFHTVVYGHKHQPPTIRAHHTSTPAVLHGYVRHRVRNQAFPGIIPSPSGSVFGCYVTGLSAANVAALDFFEGSDYERRVVTVKLLTHEGDPATGEGNVEGEARETAVYVFRNPEKLEEEEWDFDAFQKEEMHLWTRAGHAFADCDPEDPAHVAEDQK